MKRGTLAHFLEGHQACPIKCLDPSSPPPTLTVNCYLIVLRMRLSQSTKEATMYILLCALQMVNNHVT